MLYIGWMVILGNQDIKKNSIAFGKSTLQSSAFKPRLRLRQGPPSGMVLLMVADVLRVSQVIHAGLATRDPTCHPPLRGLVSPQNVELSPSTKGSIKQRMVQNASGPMHKSLHTTFYPKQHNRV